MSRPKHSVLYIRLADDAKKDESIMMGSKIAFSTELDMMRESTAHMQITLMGFSGIKESSLGIFQDLNTCFDSDGALSVCGGRSVAANFIFDKDLIGKQTTVCRTNKQSTFVLLLTDARGEPIIVEKNKWHILLKFECLS